MKRILAITLAFMFVFSIARAEAYTPGLEMSMREFVQKYNAIQAPLGSPYRLLDADRPVKWSNFDGYSCAWFTPEKNNKVWITLMTKDPNEGEKLSAGLDKIQIYVSSADDFVSFISVAIRCSTLFSTDILGESMASYCVSDVIKYFYENGAQEKGLIAYRQLDALEKTVLSFFYADGYCFEISRRDTAQ